MLPIESENISRGSPIQPITFDPHIRYGWDFSRRGVTLSLAAWRWRRCKARGELWTQPSFVRLLRMNWNGSSQLEVLAFAADPPMRFLFPDPQAYLEHFPAFAEAFGGATEGNHRGARTLFTNDS